MLFFYRIERLCECVCRGGTVEIDLRLTRHPSECNADVAMPFAGDLSGFVAL